MFVLPDPSDPDLPIPDELVVTLSESKDLVVALLDSLPKMFENTLNEGSCFTFALDVSYFPFQFVDKHIFFSYFIFLFCWFIENRRQ